MAHPAHILPRVWQGGRSILLRSVGRVPFRQSVRSSKNSSWHSRSPSEAAGCPTGSAGTAHHPKALMGQGRTQTENDPTTPLETAEGLKCLLDWHGLIRFGAETTTKKNFGMFGNGCQFPVSCSEMCVCALPCSTQCCDRPGSSFQRHIWVFGAV